MESHEPSCGAIPKTYDHTENTLFQWRRPIFPEFTGDKVLYDRARELFHLLAGET